MPATTRSTARTPTPIQTHENSPPIQYAEHGAVASANLMRRPPGVLGQPGLRGRWSPMGRRALHPVNLGGRERAHERSDWLPMQIGSPVMGIVDDLLANPGLYVGKDAVVGSDLVGATRGSSWRRCQVVPE